MTSHMRLPFASPTCDSYGRTLRTDKRRVLAENQRHLNFRNARAHIRDFSSAELRSGQ
jgi:hypothetical protein